MKSEVRSRKSEVRSQKFEWPFSAFVLRVWSRHCLHFVNNLLVHAYYRWTLAQTAKTLRLSSEQSKQFLNLEIFIHYKLQPPILCREDCFENSVPGILLRGLAVKLLFPLTRFMRAKGLYY